MQVDPRFAVRGTPIPTPRSSTCPVGGPEATRGTTGMEPFAQCMGATGTLGRDEWDEWDEHDVVQRLKDSSLDSI